ncbi:MAG: amidohydrolase [Candidatus Sericytochromatia bacterium]|nr:MAG: amidohydrolase [Candidatus Sericytochromatia bacterium]
MIRDKILYLSNKIKDEVIEWRNYLHQNPELSGEEYNTSRFVIDKLKSFGIDNIEKNIGKTCGLVATIQGKSDFTVALRADMDALPIKEKTEKTYCSKIDGVMHACGHDVHTAILLGVAKLLSEIKDEIPGNVKLIFQPSEERTDKEGAKKLVEEGVLNNVSAIFGLHVFPEIDCGKIGTRKGQLMASADIFHIKIKGKGCHASRPHMGVDTVLIAAQVINSLHHIVSRKVDPLHPAVITIGKIKGGNAENVIPDEVELSGTVRTLSINLREQIPIWIENVLSGITSSYGGSYSFDYSYGTAPVVNNNETTEFSINTLKDLLGKENIIELEYPSMGGEDFGEYLLKVPGTFLRLGVRNVEKGITAPLHSPYFDIDENAIPIGVASLSYLAYNWLSKSN